MGVLDKLLSAVKLNDDLEDDDFFDDDLMDDMDDDFLDEKEEVKPRSSFFKFGKKKTEEEFDDFDSDIEEVRKPEKKQKETPEFSQKTSTSRSFASKTEKPEKAEKAVKSSSKITPMRSGRRANTSGNTTMEVCVLQPKTMEDTHEIADTLLDNSTVILNLEGIDLELAQRISDFSFGVCYSLGGRLQKVSTYIFVLVPYNVDITGDLKNVLNGAAPSLRAGY